MDTLEVRAEIMWQMQCMTVMVEAHPLVLNYAFTILLSNAIRTVFLQPRQFHNLLNKNGCFPGLPKVRHLKAERNASESCVQFLIHFHSMGRYI